MSVGFRQRLSKTSPITAYFVCSLFATYPSVASPFSFSTTTTNNNDYNNKTASLFSTMSTYSAKSRLVYGKDDALFGAIEKQQGDRPFGRFLDAGTGLHSLRWIATLQEHDKGMTDFIAITADETMRQNVQKEADLLEISHIGKVMIGNWFPSTDSSNGSNNHNYNKPQQQLPLDKIFQPEMFDTILADYLIGAMDGFSPYEQDQMIPKLTKLLKPGGRLYIVGLEPLPDSAPGDANIICKVRQVRDACILLAGHRCYREYPVSWIQRQITAQKTPPPQQQTIDDDPAIETMPSTTTTTASGISELELLSTSTFPILYRHATIVNQINVARSKFKFFPTSELAKEMGKVLDDLEEQSRLATETRGRIRLGFDYVVTAEKKEIV